MMNPMMMNNNVNWMDCYNNLGNNNFMNFGLANINNLNNNNDDPSKWKIIFSYKGQEYKELCHCDEKTGIAFRRFCRKIGIKFKKVKFIHNAKGIYHDLTFGEAGINNDSKIQVVEINKNNNIDDEEEEESDTEGKCECEGPKINAKFHTTQGRLTVVVLSKEHSIDTMLKKYFAVVLSAILFASVYSSAEAALVSKKDVKITPEASYNPHEDAMDFELPMPNNLKWC